MFNGSYTQAQLPAQLFNNVGQTTYNGVTYNVVNNGNGTRTITPASGGGASSSSGAFDPIASAQQAQDLQIKANQPAIQTLQGQQTSMQQAYKTLLDSVLGQGTVAQNYAIQGENTLLGQRGITDNTSPLYNQQITNALLPVTAQNQAAIGSVGLGSAQDLNALAAQIAALQAGNVPNALTFGANNFNTAVGSASAQTVAQSKPFTPLSSGQTLGNTNTGVISFPNFG